MPNRIMAACMAAACFLCATASLHAGDLRHYSIGVYYKGSKCITGICVVRGDGTSGAMSVFNEFGIKAFDAVCSDNKVRVRNLVAPLDKWHVRKVLSKDMSFVFDPCRPLKRRYEIVRGNDGAFSIVNKRHGIKYEFKPIRYVVE